MHDWENADFDGTRGWYRCCRCGATTHVPQHTTTELVPPSPEETVGYPGETCDQVIAAEVETFIKDVKKKLAKAGVHRPFNRPSETVKGAILKRLKQLVDSGA